MADLTPSERMTRLSARLGLADDSQDWGIINADPERLEEFAALFESEELSSTERYEVSDLVLASANERLLIDPSDDLAIVERLLGALEEVAELHVSYWRRLEDPEEFPLGHWLRGREISDR